MQGMSASSEGVFWFTATCGNAIYEKFWYVCVVVKCSGEKYNVLNLVTVVSIAVRILVVFVHKNFRV